MKIQLITAVTLCLAGLTLLFMGFWIPPEGEIHNSVRTFAGALFGVDYKYRKRD